MQITLNQKEIEKAILAYVSGQITINGKAEISLKAGRGETGMSATIDITDNDETCDSNPEPTKVTAPVETPECGVGTDDASGGEDDSEEPTEDEDAGLFGQGASE